ncbi:GlxA family transcriptional regulator [Rhizobium johnstonii]|uniref:GlxA family transcriptional regulator n=1 Tax=Rhizobium leguminosarum bv. viciae TaxID=387 RepID=A0A8G2J1K5_RHILV|nr:GlxA family transcriptional regulator [Rhizobium leguminosarum]MBB4508651.1 transcriptional regulator GlxA family with amidase domain [Rhizobium leguminosarum]MBY5340822.1 GlxA family transcriptional regulator [Rhizobium leguminosarum]MBY5426743.1 GlxA family transcriptional regulator [Rhizobium leguminosarum]NEH42318.1 helix-turn-helix domain-containing protein [Rhizobium leguminosarum]NEI56577.1 helix-turn-helix domain-containing protein [Rhizobium leguminosarum]
MTDQTYTLKQLAQGHRPIRIGFFLVPDFPLMTFAAALDSLRQGNRLAKRKAFEWLILSADGGHVKSSSGLGFDADAAIGRAPRCDIVILCAGINYADAYDANVFAWLRRIYSEGCVLGAVSTAVFFLAKARLLEGRRCAVHWESLASFRSEFPNCLATDDIFAIDGRFLTSSGGTVTLDMMLYLISAVEGRELAALISDQFNHARIRRQDDVQRMSPEDRFGIRNAKLAFVVRRMEASLGDPVEISDLASSVALSLRQLERLFHANLGKSPTHFYIELRMTRAKELLVYTELAIGEIAEICGYQSASHFGRSYRTRFRESPAATRKAERRREVPVS